MRKEALVNGEVYHILNKSIAGFKIFNKGADFDRMIDTIRYYQKQKPINKFSRFVELSKNEARNISNINISIPKNKKLVEIIAYCIMPTHIHLILKQLKEKGISEFMRVVCDSYAKFFNIKHNRRGPLWEGRFKNILIKTDEQLLHLTRYIHLNPVTAGLVNRPENWPASSYREYAGTTSEKRICNYTQHLDIELYFYKKFVRDKISFQKALVSMEKIFLE